MLSLAAPTLNDLVSEISDLLKDREGYLRIEYITGLIRQVDGFKVNVGPKRAAIQPGQLRRQLLVNLVERCRMDDDGDGMVRLVEAISGLGKQDIESIFVLMIDHLEDAKAAHLAPFAIALIALCKKLCHAKLGYIIDSLDLIIWSNNDGESQYMRAFEELVSLVRYTLKQDPKLRQELAKRAKWGSPFCILVLCGMTFGTLGASVEQIEADVRCLKTDECDASFIMGPERLAEIVCMYVSEHDEAGILLLLDSINSCHSMMVKRAGLRQLLKKSLAKETIINKALWPVNHKNHVLLHEIEGQHIQTHLYDNVNFMVEIDRQDCIPVVLDFMSNDRILSFLNNHTGKLTNNDIFVSLVTKKNDEITVASLEHLQYIFEKSEFLCKLIIKRIQNNMLAKYLVKLFFEDAGKDSPELISWISLCNSSSQFHPFLVIGFCSIQHEECDERVMETMKILCEFLTSQSEYPNDPSKLTILIPAFTMCIDYAVKSKRPRSLKSKLIKRRHVLRGKLAEKINDFCLSDETVHAILGMEDSDLLLCEQIKLADRRFSRSQYEQASVCVKKAMLPSSVELESVVSTSDIDMMMQEIENISAKKEASISCSFLSDIECESVTKLKKLVEFGCKFGANLFIHDCIHDIQEICGKIEDSSQPEKAVLTGVKKFKFSSERHVQAILGCIIAHLEEKLSTVNGVLKTLRRYEEHFNNYVNHITINLSDIAAVLTSLCRVALEGAGWERSQNLLILFYQVAIIFMRFMIKTNNHNIDEGMIKMISSELTKAIYLLIPVAHQLDHESMKSAYEMGKGLGKKDKDSNNGKSTKKTTKWDTKIAREAARLPRLIFLIETFDCLVVKMSTNRPELSKHVYRSTARDFRINMEQVEAALVASEPESDIESGPENS